MRSESNRVSRWEQRRLSGLWDRLAVTAEVGSGHYKHLTHTPDSWNHWRSHISTCSSSSLSKYLQVESHSPDHNFLKSKSPELTERTISAFRPTRAWSLKSSKEKQLEEHLTDNQDNFQQVGLMIGYIKSILERQSLTTVKTTPHCEHLIIYRTWLHQNTLEASLEGWSWWLILRQHCFKNRQILWWKPVTLHIWKGSISAERYKLVLEPHLLHPDVFFRKAFMSDQDHAKLHARLCRRRVRLLNLPDCSPELLYQQQDEAEPERLLSSQTITDTGNMDPSNFTK